MERIGSKFKKFMEIEKQKGITLRPWQARAASYFLDACQVGDQVMDEPAGKSFLVRELSEFIGDAYHK